MNSLLTRFKAKKNSLVYLIIFIAFSFAIYAPSIFGDPFWDDWVFIFRSLRDQMSAPTPLIFFPGGSEAKSWPVFFTVIWAMYKTFKTKYYLYHIVNILFHALNGFLCWKILRRLKIKNPFLFSLLFIAHPLQLFTVSWIIQLKTVLSIFFFLLSLNFLITFSYKNKLRYYFLSLFLFVLSLLTKSTTVAFAVCILFSFPLFKKRISLKKFLVLFLSPFLILSAASVLRTTWTYQVKEYWNKDDIETSPANAAKSGDVIAGKTQYEPEEGPGEVHFDKLLPTDRMVLAAKLLSRYVFFMVLPQDSHFLFQKKTNLTFDSLELLLILACVFTFYLLIEYFRKRKLYVEMLGIIFFLASLVPFCGLFFVPIFTTTNFVPYWLSIPFLGVLPALAHFIKSKKVLVAIILVAAFTTHWQSYEFINVADIFIDSIKRAPEKKVYQISLIEHYTFTGQCEKAREEYQKFTENDFSKMFCLDIKVNGCDTAGEVNDL